VWKIDGDNIADLGSKIIAKAHWSRAQWAWAQLCTFVHCNC